MSKTLNKLVARHGLYRAHKEAIVLPKERLTWQQFHQQTKDFAQSLQACGIGKGDAVAAVLPNCKELITLYWATASIGAVVVPMSPLMLPRGLRNLLADCQAKIVFVTGQLSYDIAPYLADGDSLNDLKIISVGANNCTASSIHFDEFLRLGKQLSTPFIPPTITDDDLFNIVYSSGTTGIPKGIEHTHEVRFLYGSLFANAFRITPESVVLHTGSIVFNGAFVTLMPCFFQGAKYVLRDYFDVEDMISTIKQEQVTHVMMVPSQIAALLDSPNCNRENLASLQMILSLGSPLDNSYKQRLLVVAPDCLHELYGLTEGVITVLDKEDVGTKLGSVGIPLPGFEIAIINDQGLPAKVNEIGEITGTSPLMMRGYHNRAELTNEVLQNNWLATGDMGYLDADGYLYLAGRRKELIISGGVNVYPADIEAIALQHPDISSAAVFGVESEKWGESPIAAVILSPTSQASPTELQTWINDRVEARFQRVVDVFICHAFPQNVAGKVLKHELKDSYKR